MAIRYKYTIPDTNDFFNDCTSTCTLFLRDIWSSVLWSSGTKSELQMSPKKTRRSPRTRAAGILGNGEHNNIEFRSQNSTKFRISSNDVSKYPLSRYFLKKKRLASLINGRSLELSFLNLFRHGHLVNRTIVREIIYNEEDDEMHGRLTAELGDGRRHVRLAYETEIDSKKNSLKNWHIVLSDVKCQPWRIWNVHDSIPLNTPEALGHMSELVSDTSVQCWLAWI